MPTFCAVVNCGVRGDRDGNNFFRIPCSPKLEHTESGMLKLQRRRKWIAALKRDDLTRTKLKYARICDRHFISGKPAALKDVNNPDWIPNQNMAYKTVQCQQSVLRNLRVHDRANKVENQQSNRNQTNDGVASISSSKELVASCVPFEDGCIMTKAVDTQTDLTMQDILNMELALNNMTCENVTLKEKNNFLLMNEETFKDNNKCTLFYTGLPTYALLMLVYDLISDSITETSLTVLSKFQKFLITLMHLRLNLLFTDLGYRFGVSPATVSRAFHSCLDIMHAKLHRLVQWPERQDLWKTMPQTFQDSFGRRVAVIIDCFEVAIEKPSNVRASAQVWSHYKHRHTVKFLVGMCPQGCITFISKAWGGRTSDKELTLNCGLLEKLLPGDLVLADRGFLISDAVELYCAEVKTPSFTKGRQQLSAVEVEESRNLSHVRAHVERIIGSLRQKYTILSSTLPIRTLQDEETPIIDKIVLVCSALVNLCPGIVPLQ